LKTAFSGLAKPSTEITGYGEVEKNSNRILIFIITHDTLLCNHILLGNMFRPWLWSVIRSLQKNMKMYS